MFKTAMSKMNVDVKRMPLGQLSNAQVRFAGVGVQAFLIRTQKRSIHGTPDSRHPPPRKRGAAVGETKLAAATRAREDTSYR